jgi:hypothetical protein
MLRKTLITLAAAVALGCVPLATNASAAPTGHPAGHATGHAIGHAGGHAVHAQGGRVGARYSGGYRGGPGYNGPIYDSYDGCAGYAYGPGYGCPGYGVPFVGGIVNGILGGY